MQSNATPAEVAAAAESKTVASPPQPQADIGPQVDALRSARVTNSSLQGYDQITAITQGALNAELKKIWESEEKCLHIALDDGARELHAVTNAPGVQLVFGRDNRTVIYYINLESGSFQWWKGYGSKAELVTEQFSNWRLAFRVHLNLQEIKNRETVSANITARLQPYGECGVKALLIDLATAKFDERASNLPGLEKPENSSTQNAVRRSQFIQYMNEYPSTMARSNDFTVALGYLPELASPSSAAPNTVCGRPTSLTTQNYPYLLDPSKPQDYVSDLYSEDSASVSQANKNVLVVLGMTDNRPLPMTGLDIAANWVVPGKDAKVADGTIALSRRAFLDGYLIPKLGQINKKFAVFAHGTDCTLGNMLQHERMFDVRFGWNISEKPADFYKWDPVKDTTPSNIPQGILANAFASYAAVAHGPCFVWKWENNTLKEDKEGFTSKLLCSNKNWIVIPKLPQGNKCAIYLCGVAKINAEYSASFINEGSSTMEAKWSAEIVFDSTAEGKHVVTCRSGKPQVTSASKGNLSDGKLDKLERQFKDMINNTLPLDQVKSALQELFDGKWQFFFPGGGFFTLKDPVFNYNGDLLLDLTYKAF